MKIAVEGCCHGELDKIYETLAYLEEINNVKVDLLLMCGDFQAVRNKSDLHCMAVPQKYQCMNTFYKYYSGEKKAPVLTVFIGGNHEASNYLQELPYGGWVAPNIFYMGYANVLRFGGLRIAGLSGIYKAKHYSMGHFEHPPYSEDSKRSAYHIRNLEVFRLKQISRPLDIVLTHDWPKGIYNFGNKENLIRHKPFLQNEIEADCLGSPPAEELLYKLKPEYWFAAHLHTKFAALVEHQPEGEGCKTTKFLSLDKCLPRRRFLQVLDFPHDEGFPLKLELDPEWLCILRSTNHLLSLKRAKSFMPGPGSSEKWDFHVTDEEIESIKEDFGNDLTIPENFTTTVPAYTVNDAGKNVSEFPQPTIHVNPQTTLICTMLELSDPNAMFLGRDSSFALDPDDVANASASRESDDEDVHTDGSETDDANATFESSIDVTFNSSINPDEILLDNDEDEGIGEMENESEANISTASSGAGDAEESLAVGLSGINPMDQSFDAKDDEAELNEILSAQASKKAILSESETSGVNPMEQSFEVKDDDAELNEILSAQAVSKETVLTEVTDPSSVVLGPMSSPYRPIVEGIIATSSPREASDQASASETEKSSQEETEDEELEGILSAQARFKDSSAQSHDASGGCEISQSVEFSPSPRTLAAKQKYSMNSTIETENLPTSKKLKRRNFSMYSGDEEDCV